MKETDLQTVILYLLNNNRSEFIEALTQRLPNIVLTNFYPVIDQLNNDELSLYLTGFLRIGYNLSMVKDLKISYNVNANNETVTDEIFEYIKTINSDNSDITLEDILVNGEPKSMEWLQSIGDFFGGKTEPETTTESKTTEETNWLLILSIMVGLLGFAFMVFKYYRKSPVGKS